MNPIDDLRDRLEEAYKKSENGDFNKIEVKKLISETNKTLKKIIARNKEIQNLFE